MSTIAVTGATGQLGRLAIAALIARGDTPIALVRSPEKASDLNVEARVFDYESADAAALAGIDTLVLISSSEVGRRLPQHEAVIAAAKSAGVKHLIYTSLLKADTGGMQLAGEHIGTEQAIAASGIPATILRNGWYVENHTGTLAGSVAAGGFIGASGDGRIHSVPRADFAEAIAAVATGTGHEGKVYELAGDTGFTMEEFAAEVSRLTGKSLPYTNLPQTAYAEALEGFGLPGPFAAILADSDARAADGALADDSGTLSRLIGRPTTPWQSAVAAALA